MPRVAALLDVAQVSDIAAANPEAYSHVRFIVPNEHEEHVLFEMVDGLVLGRPPRRDHRSLDGGRNLEDGFQKDFACRGQRHRSPIPSEERRPHHPLKLYDVAAERRLSHSHSLRRAREMESRVLGVCQRQGGYIAASSLPLR